MKFVTGPEGAKIIVENTGFAPTNTKVIEDASYLGDFYAKNPDHCPPSASMEQFGLIA